MAYFKVSRGLAAAIVLPQSLLAGAHARAETEQDASDLHHVFHDLLFVGVVVATVWLLLALAGVLARRRDARERQSR